MAESPRRYDSARRRRAFGGGAVAKGERLLSVRLPVLSLSAVHPLRCGAWLLRSRVDRGGRWDRLWDRFTAKTRHFDAGSPVGPSGTSRIYKGFRHPRRFLL